MSNDYLKRVASWEETTNKTLDEVKWFVKEFDRTEVRNLSAIEKLEFRPTWGIVLDTLLWGWLPKWALVEIAWPNSSWKTTIAIMTIKTMQEKYDLQVMNLLLEMIDITWPQLNKEKVRLALSKIITWAELGKQKKKADLMSKIIDECLNNWENKLSKEDKVRLETIQDEIDDILINKGHSVYIDVEWALTKWWAERFGLDDNKITVVNANTAETVFDALEWILWKDYFEIIVLDSIWAIGTKAEDEASMEQQTMWLKARVLAKWMRKIWFRHDFFLNSVSKPTFILVNHVYATMDQWKPLDSAGWNGIKYAFSTRIFVSRVWSKYVFAWDQVLDENVSLRNPDEQIGTTVRFDIIKNKVTSPNWRAETKLIFKQPTLKDGSMYDKVTIWFNKYEELTDWLLEEQILVALNSKTYSIEAKHFPEEFVSKETIQNLKFDWEAYTWFFKAFSKEMKENQEFFDLLMNAYQKAQESKMKIEIEEIDLDDLR